VATLATPPSTVRRVAYLGSPAIAVPALHALVGAGLEVALVVSQPDKRRGRGGGATPSPVKAAAAELGIPTTDDVSVVVDAGVDLGVVVAFGRLISDPVLGSVPMVNMHYSLLPRWRGAAPVERAILAGDSQTGVCVMAVASELDAGDVYARGVVPIGERDTTASLYERLTEVGVPLLVGTILDGHWDGQPQQGEVTYAAKLTSEDRHLDWTRSVTDLARIIRVGGAWTTLDGRRVKIHDAEVVDGDTSGIPATIAGVDVRAADGVLRLITVQPEGKATVAAGDWANGSRLEPGARFGT